MMILRLKFLSIFFSFSLLGVANGEMISYVDPVSGLEKEIIMGKKEKMSQQDELLAQSLAEFIRFRQINWDKYYTVKQLIDLSNEFNTPYIKQYFKDRASIVQMSEHQIWQAFEISEYKELISSKNGIELEIRDVEDYYINDKKLNQFFGDIVVGNIMNLLNYKMSKVFHCGIRFDCKIKLKLDSKNHQISYLEYSKN